MYINRHLETQILDASKYYPVVMVCGQRQVGKSTILNHLCEESRRYVTFDDANAKSARVSSSSGSCTLNSRIIASSVSRSGFSITSYLPKPLSWFGVTELAIID